MKHFYTLLSLILATSFSQLNADILYVKPGTSSSAWQNRTNVYSDLQTALAAAVAGDEVWVAAGIYKPTNDGNREISFELKDWVQYYGGFVGNETDIAQRNWRENETILSGDIGVEGDNTDNSYHVLTARGAGSSPITDKTRIDGFIIEKGYADQNRDGGGLYLKYASPVILNCHFKNNYASDDGGAVYGDDFSDGIFGNVIFSGNSAGCAGGAVCSSYSELEFYNCVWYDNHSVYWGGGVRAHFAKVYNSIAWNNMAIFGGDDFSGPDVFYSIYKIRSSTYNNISADPHFIDPENGDFRIRNGSLAINGGNSENLPDFLETDFSGNDRIQNDTIDIGVFEGGGIETPLLKSPHNNTVLESTVSKILLEWQWTGEEPENITGYELEYIIDGVDTTVVKNVQQMNYSLTGVNPTEKIQWCVRGMNGSGLKDWSRRYDFYISRGHPIYVKPSADGDGTSWAYAMGLKEALNVAVFGDSLWIARGTYKPTNDGDRSISFELKDGIKYYGGFSGDETELSQRNWYDNKTILSGDIGVEGDNSDNSYHVLTAHGAGSSSITDKTRIDGFIIEKGHADGFNEYYGGGLYLKYASPVILNCHFKNNYASYYGGAVYGDNLSDGMFGNVIFSGNSAGDIGGGVHAYDARMKFYNCVWYGNHAVGNVGAIRGRASKVYNSIAWNNSASSNGDDFSQADVYYSIYERSSSDDHNNSEDPQFIDPGNGDFRIRKGSPAINGGNSEKLPDLLVADYLGNARIQNDTIDIGAFEGGVETPLLKSPRNGDFIESNISEVLLKWQWPGEEPGNITGYELEYIINDVDTTVVKNIQQMDYTLTGLNPTGKIQWRVRGMNGSGIKNWSRQNDFYISRGHPLYVKLDAQGNGTSWANAMGLKEALDVSVFGDSLWVAMGTYKPSNDGDRSISFKLRDGVALFGGFSGKESSLNKRNWYVNKTILSGDIGVEGDSTDNSYHVLNAQGTRNSHMTNKTRLDGFTIENGYADGSGIENDGGGLKLKYASPVIQNCHFKNNYASDQGGAVYGTHSSEGMFGNVIFSSNSAGDDGGAVYGYYPEMEFYNCVWYGNHSGDQGGAIRGGTSKVYNSIAWNNKAQYNYDFHNNVSAFYSVFKNAANKNGNIDQKPCFVDGENSDFRLTENSPAINRGSTKDVPDWLVTDFYGNPRIQEDTVNIGLAEGFVIISSLISPANNTYLESDSLNVLLEWGWADAIPDNFVRFELEYTINNNDPVLIDTLSGFEFKLQSLSPGNAVRWRVCSVEESGLKNWSSLNTFTVNRDHPLYVKPGARGNGTSWLDALDLKDALEISVRNDEIWVAAGTYKPTNDVDRNASFELKNGVKLYGGFGGYEASIEERDWMTNQTILSGDIGVKGDASDNSYHVMKIMGAEDYLFEDNIVDGFIIEKGNSGTDGGGIYIRRAAPELRNLWLRDNQAWSKGGAVFSEKSSNPAFYNVLFSNNSASSHGGAVYTYSDASFHSCLWYGNFSYTQGGAFYNRGNKIVEINNSIAWNNEASLYPDFNFSKGIHHSIFANADGSNGNISGNPLFIDPANNVFHLQKGSPAINAGDNELIPDSLLVDFAGFDRILGENVDVGPFEHFHLENVSPRPGGSGTNEFNLMGMVVLSWGITDGMMTPDLNVPGDFDFELKLWKEGEEENLLQQGSFSPQDGMPGTNNSTHVWEVEHGNAYQWSIGMDYGNYVEWSDPTTFYIGHDHTIKVKEGNPGTTGKTWADAFGTLTEAIDYAIPGDEILVAAGTYYPVTPADPNNVSQTERETALSLKPGLAIYGGLAGDELYAGNRNHVENKTILSGDIGVAGDNSDNSFNLIRNEFEASAPLENGAVIEGFIFEDATGSAIYNVNASPSVEYSIFRNNEGVNGGAVYNERSSPHFFNVLFHDNKASQNGGAVFADKNSKPELLSCTVTDNTATATGGLSGMFDVKSSIVYGNENGQLSDDESSVVYSCVEGGFNGEENISYDPLWTDPANDDFTLQEYSPCIDQGNKSYFMEWFPYDLAKRKRIHWLETDMGAYEVQKIGKFEVVESSIRADSPVDFIDSIIIRFNKPIAVDTSVVPVFNPNVEAGVKVSEVDSTVLIITHPGLHASSDYHLKLLRGQVTLANNDMIKQWIMEYDFRTRDCIPVALSVENPDFAVCPRTSGTLKVDIKGDPQYYTWIFNDQDSTLSQKTDSLFLEAVMPENTGTYTLLVNDWCGSSDEISLNLQYKSGTELVIPEPKWKSVYFVDNQSGNFSDFKWFLDSVEVSDKQYLDTRSMYVHDLTVVAFDEASQCFIYGEVGQIKSVSLKSAIVSPNPVASGNPVDILLPGMSEKSRIRLFDMRGALLIDQEFKESSILQLEDTDFNSGVYLLQIEYNDGTIENKKLIIE